MDAVTVLLLIFFATWLAHMVSLFDLQGYLGRHHILETMQHLQSFKQMARRQMYWTVALTFAYWGVALLGIYIFILRLDFGLPRGVMLVVLFLLAEFTFFQKRRVREQVFNLPAADKGIESLHQAVCLEWSRKTLPEF